MYFYPGSNNNKKISKNTEYCVRVTANDGEIGENALKQFQDNEKSIPTILTTSQKLSTGVDARNVRNIVLMRPVNQIIEFKQIVGRGTRTFDGKDYFTIYDFVDAHQRFLDPEWDGEPEDPVIPHPTEPKPDKDLDDIPYTDEDEFNEKYSSSDPMGFEKNLEAVVITIVNSIINTGIDF
jgi:type I restriction enzyme R subunit